MRPPLAKAEAVRTLSPITGRYRAGAIQGRFSFFSADAADFRPTAKDFLAASTSKALAEATPAEKAARALRRSEPALSAKGAAKITGTSRAADAQAANRHNARCLVGSALKTDRLSGSAAFKRF